MKRLLLIFISLCLLTGISTAGFKKVQRYNRVTHQWLSVDHVTIHDIQYVLPDSLRILDSLQTSGRPSLQYPPRINTASTLDDTVSITAVCVIPPKTIGYTAAGFTMVVYDTANDNNQWRGLVIRCNSPTDTAQNIIDGFLNVERGDIINMTGRLSDFGTGVNTLTQFQPIAGIPIDIVGSMDVPAPVQKNDSVQQFYQGTYQSSGPYHVQYSTGEPYEGMYVQFTNLTITGYANVGGRNAIIMVDGSGNTLAMHDASKWFTVTGVWKDPSSTWSLPPVLAVMDTIRGIMIQISGGSATYGYVIAPMFPGDVVFGIAKPTVSTHSRTPNIVKIDSAFTIKAKATQTAGGYPVDSVFVVMSTNYGPFTKTLMEIVDTGSIYGATFSDLPPGTFVRYFIQAYDTGHQNSKLAFQGPGFVGTDTSLGFFNFTVLSGDPTIHDLQYTPYSHGVSPYYGAKTTVRGIVTADTSDIKVAAHNGFGTTAMYIQSGTSPWSGIWVAAPESVMAGIQRGDSVAVTGTVSEFNGNTEMFSVQYPIVVLSSGNTVPEPVTLSSGTFSSGNPNAEQYEGMLIRIVGSHVADLYPYFSDQKLFTIDDGSGQMYYGPDGQNNFSNIPGDTVVGAQILYLNDPIDTLIGIVYYNSSANRYTINPRKNSDILAGAHVDHASGWNLISVGREQNPSSTGYYTTTLFPTATSEAFRFAGAYVTDSVLSHGVGYWLKFPSAGFSRQLGLKRTSETIPVVTGWNLVGMIGDSLQAGNVNVEPSGNTLSQFFAYNNGYSIASMLYPSKGYWVKSDSDGQITMSSSLLAKGRQNSVDMSKFNSLAIEGSNGATQTLYFGLDAEGKINLKSFEMPPPSPSGVVDARFISGRMLETYPSVIADAQKFAIAIRNAEGSVKIHWNIVSQDKKTFTLDDGSGRNTLSLKGEGKMSLGSVSTLLLTVSDVGAKPKEFSLSQNYPNPFNPTTQFTIGLPANAQLDVVVYNILGQKVATLASGTREAGYYTITWNSTADNGTLASSGIYFVKMIAGDFTSVRKIVLMK